MLQFTPSLLSARGKRLRWLTLGVVSAPIVGTWLISQGQVLPRLNCPIRYFTGIPCPTCGMTRSFVAIASGDWQRAIDLHLFGPVIFLGLLLLSLHLFLELVSGRRVRGWHTQVATHQATLLLFVMVYLGYYLLRISTWFQTGELPVEF